MTDSELHPYVELIAREAKRPVVTDASARARVMAAVRALPVPRRRVHVWERLFEPRAFTISPLRTGLIAAGLVGIGVIAGGAWNNRDARAPGGQPLADERSHLPVSADTVVKFVYVAPRAEKVFVVGDFNDWDATKTPMVRASNDGAWTVTLPLSVGRHLYGFVVDGAWATDPSAPRAPEDGFGRANSVKLVRRGSSL